MFIGLERLGDIVQAESVRSDQIPKPSAAIKLRTNILRGYGVGKGVPVALSQLASPDFFADLLAIWSCGAQAICLDVSLTPAERANVLAFSSAKFVLLASGDESGSWPVQKLVLSEMKNDERAKAMQHPATPMLDDPALVLFTSGTTGDPKGVVHSFRSLQARMALNAMAIGLGPGDTALLTLPVHFGHGLIGNALSPLFAGARLIVAPKGMTLASKLASVIDDYGVTFLSSVPAFWRMAMKLGPKPKSSSLRRVHVGSAPLSLDLMKRIEDWAGCEVYNCYGITETGNWIGGASSRDPLMRDGFVGRPWGGAAAVLSADGKMHSIGEGEIVVETPSLMTGYLARPDLTAAAFIDGWFRTGDWGTVDHIGNICLSGRLKDEINRAGFKVQPAEIDMLLESHDDVEEACTFGIPDVLGTEIVAAAVKLKEKSTQTPDSLRAWCLERLRRDATPERWFIVQEIPKTSRGKLRRDVVRKTVLGEQ